jgi:hypothetical protein
VLCQKLQDFQAAKYLNLNARKSRFPVFKQQLFMEQWSSGGTHSTFQAFGVSWAEAPELSLLASTSSAGRPRKVSSQVVIVTGKTAPSLVWWRHFSAVFWPRRLGFLVCRGRKPGAQARADAGQHRGAARCHGADPG